MDSTLRCVNSKGLSSDSGGFPWGLANLSGETILRFMCITQTSEFLNYLHAGDEVMGDCAFIVWDLLEECRVNLIIPAFTCKGCHLTNEEMTHTQSIAHTCIYVERAIRCLNKVNEIISEAVPINLVPKKDLCWSSEFKKSEKTVFIALFFFFKNSMRYNYTYSTTNTWH